MMAAADRPASSLAVLFVDDEPASRRLFSRSFGDEFKIVCAQGASEALEVLAAGEHEFAALVTDYRMPQSDGLKLLHAVQRDHRQLVRLLVTAYAGKDVAIAAVNQGKVLRILEKPLDDHGTREALREAITLYRTQALERAMNEGRASTMRETLGFLAHELNTPLATVRGCVANVASRHVDAADAPGIVQFTEDRPGEVMEALERAERRALYCQSLVSTFLQSARDAYPGAVPQTVSAAALLEALLGEYPFESNERSFVASAVRQDFRLPGRRDLLYLVLCTITKNALLALRNTAAPRLRIEAGRACADTAAWIDFTDNGPGIPEHVLGRLTREPVTTRAESGGNGMGLMFCQRVMQSLGGSVTISSQLGQGTTVKLVFSRTV